MENFFANLHRIPRPHKNGVNANRNEHGRRPTIQRSDQSRTDQSDELEEDYVYNNYGMSSSVIDH